MKCRVFASAAVVALAVSSFSTPVIAAVPAKKLLWSQEFNETAGTAPNAKYFDYDLGGGGWGNKELQWYTQEAVATNGKGQLEISATRIPAVSEDELPYSCFGDCQYFSGRIKTQGKVRFKYGRMEARIQMPEGEGVWPAFWMLGNNITAKTWPTCGEIDVVELRGREPFTAIASAHGPGYSGANSKTSIKKLSTSLAAGYHTYAVDWTANKISWYLDGKLFHTVSSSSVKPNSYVFNQDFFLILNLAMGGEFDGGRLDSSIEKATMSIDYIRYYSLGGIGKVTYK